MVLDIQNKYHISNDHFILHFWVGSLCGILDNRGKPAFPRGVVAVSDIITLIEDLGNQYQINLGCYICLKYSIDRICLLNSILYTHLIMMENLMLYLMV